MFDYFHNTVVSTVIVIQRTRQLWRSAYIEACIDVGMYNVHHFCEVPIDHAFTRSCLCLNATRNKDSSWYAEHVIEKRHNGILIRSCISTLHYHPSYILQDHLGAVQYSLNEWYDTSGVLFIIKRVDVVNINCLLPHLIYIRLNIYSNRIENQSTIPL